MKQKRQEKQQEEQQKSTNEPKIYSIVIGEYYLGISEVTLNRLGWAFLSAASFVAFNLLFSGIRETIVEAVKASVGK